jgi:UDP-N-acetylmuramate dehydrogenase
MKIKKNQKLSDYTTIGIGGPVPVVYLPETESELIDLLKQLTAEGIQFRTLGNGSNVLADDRGFDEPLVCTRSLERVLRVDGNILTADAGYPMAQLAYQSASKGLTGLEFAVGIPGSIGGVVRMNAGAHGHTISEVVDSVRILKKDGSVVVASNQELQFTYRSAAIPRDAIITEVNLKLQSEDSKKIHAKIREFNEHRTSTQPLREKSAGCIFKNPGKCAAGKLIQDSGLKGFSIGGAVVSELHGNFIINRNHATFDDVLKLIDHIKKTVHDSQGVDLQEEVIIWRERSDE